jgi:hypothetical protein
MTRDQIAWLAHEIRLKLSDFYRPKPPELELARWQGALAAPETVLGEPPSTVDGPAAAQLSQVSTGGVRGERRECAQRHRSDVSARL